MNCIAKTLLFVSVILIFGLSACQDEPDEALQSPLQEIVGEGEDLAEGTGEEMSEAPGDHLVDTPPEKQLSEKMTDAAKTVEKKLEEAKEEHQ